MNRRLTFYLPVLLGLLLLSGTVVIPKEPVVERREAVPGVKERFSHVKPAHSALMGNQSSVGGEFEREPR